jgi:hypothetical protein
MTKAAQGDDRVVVSQDRKTEGFSGERYSYSITLYRTQDPLFVNEGAGGLAYRIRSDSPARDAGAVIPGVTDGYVGSAPDIGAYEYGGTDWTAGCNLPESTSPARVSGRKDAQSIRKETTKP